MKGRVAIGLLVGIIFFSSCKSRKKSVAYEVNAESVASYWASAMNFENIEVRGKAALTINGKTNNVSMHLKMKKDSIVWGKFSLFGFGATVLITTDSFYMVDNINQSYVAYESSYLNNYLGFKADVGQLQNVLVGNAIFEKGRYKLSDRKNGLVANEGIATNTLEINEAFRTLVSSIATSDTTQAASMQYNNYEIFERHLMPKVVTIALRKGTQNIEAVLNYQNVNANPNLSFPLKIPKGYRRK